MSDLKKETVKTSRISEACELFKDCPLGWDCLVEITLTGSTVWSIELCHDLINLIACGYVKYGGGEYRNFMEVRIAIGMYYTFHGPLKREGSEK